MSTFFFLLSSERRKRNNRGKQWKSNHLIYKKLHIKNNYFFTQIHCCSSFYWLLIQSISWANKMTDICNMYTDLKNTGIRSCTSWNRNSSQTERNFPTFLQTNLSIPSSFQQIPYFVIRMVKTYHIDTKKVNRTVATIIQIKGICTFRGNYIHNQSNFSLRAQITSLMFFKTH